MNLDGPAAWFVPALAGACALEFAVARWLGRRVYGHRQTLNNFAVGIAARATMSAIGIAPMLGYTWLRDRLGLFTWAPDDPVHHALCFAVTDFGMFLRHWAGHRVAFLWALHGVHHQSREYNLSVAGRLAAFADTILFAVPAAVLGFPLEMVLPWFLAGNAWMFFQHTELVGRLPVLDGLVMTPANHRVHHGCNPQYLDRNYGNILLWDRLFGTYAPEVEPVRYGVLTGLRTYDGTENNLEPLRRLWRKVARQRRLRDKLAVVFGPPGWEPGSGEVEPSMVDDPEPQRRADVTPGVRVGSTLLVGLGALLAAPLIAGAGSLGWPVRAVWLGAVWVLLAAGGVVLDRQWEEPEPADGALGRARASLAAAVATLAGRDARGPLYWLSRALKGK